MSFIDLMHTVDLGILQDIIACTIRAWHEHNLLPDATSDAQTLHLFWHAFCRCTRAKGVSTPKGKLTLAGLSFGKQEYHACPQT